MKLKKLVFISFVTIALLSVGACSKDQPSNANTTESRLKFDNPAFYESDFEYEDTFKSVVTESDIGDNINKDSEE